MIKYIATILITLAARVALAAVEGEDWLPTPDGYKWPSHAQVQLTEDKEIRTAELPQALRNAFEENWPDDSLPAVVHVREADLNSDGKPELFLRIPILGGTGGSFYQILTPVKDGVRDIGGVQGAIALCDVKNGWLRIEGGSRAGGGEYTRYLLEYRDGKYLEVRNEGHNYNTNKVEVRRTEPADASNRSPRVTPAAGASLAPRSDGR